MGALAMHKGPIRQHFPKAIHILRNKEVNHSG